jgi:hypothetical protein
MNKIFTLISIGLISASTFAQTNPTPFNLATGDYTFTQWDNTSAAGTYPANMIFQTTSNSNDSLGFTANLDWICSYNFTNRSRIVGQGVDGVSFKRTGSSFNNACGTDTLTPTTIKHPGAALLALNTAGRENIQIGWTGRMLSSFTYSASGTTVQSRMHAIKLQYRIDTASSFIDVPVSSRFNCNSDATTYKPLGTNEAIPAVTLPTSCNNLPYMQVRWIYYQSIVGGGQRAELGIDDITVTSTIFTSVKNTVASQNLKVYPNPSTEHVINFNKVSTGQIYTAIGAVVADFNNTTKVDLTSLTNGVYFVKTNKGEIVKLIVQ